MMLLEREYIHDILLLSQYSDSWVILVYLRIDRTQLRLKYDKKMFTKFH